MHVGHLRLVVEACEALQCDRVELVPCATPPHKLHGGLLPFDMRVSMLEAVVRGLPGFHVSEMEACGERPSYTVETLAAFALAHPEAERYFLLGIDDFAHMHQWWQGRELPRLATLAVVPRNDKGRMSFGEIVTEYWPGAHPIAVGEKAMAAFALGDASDAGKALFLLTPRMDISSTTVRRLWLEGRSVRYLMPDAALRILENRRHDARKAWRQPSPPEQRHVHHHHDREAA